MNNDTAMSLFVLILAAIGVALFIFLIPTPVGASQVCLTRKEARHLWPKQHIYWYSKDHCWSNRRGPPRGLKLDPIIPNHARAEVKENPAKPERLPPPKMEAPLRSDGPLNITRDGCCWPSLWETRNTQFDLRWIGELK